MNIRCKFKVDKITRINSSKWIPNDPNDNSKGGKSMPIEMRSVEMSPVYANGDPTHENSKFWSATPSGSLRFDTVNLDAVATLDLGAEYYIDIVVPEKA